MRARRSDRKSAPIPRGIYALFAALLCAAVGDVGAVAVSDLSAEALLSVSFAQTTGVTVCQSRSNRLQDR